MIDERDPLFDPPLAADQAAESADSGVKTLDDEYEAAIIGEPPAAIHEIAQPETALDHTALDEMISDDFSDDDLHDAAFGPAREMTSEAPGQGAADPMAPHAGGADPAVPPPSHQGRGPQQPRWTTIAPAPPERQLMRSRTNKKVAGICGGLGEYLGFDANLVRLVMIILAFSGVGIILYPIGWLIIPKRKAGDQAPATPRSGHRIERNLGVVVAILAVGVAMGFIAESTVMLAVALVAAGAWLLSQQPAAETAEVPVATAGAPSAATANPAHSASYPVPPEYTGWDPQDYLEDYSHNPDPPTTTTPVEDGRGPQRITRLVFALLALYAGLTLAAGAGGWWELDPQRILGIGVTIIGGGVLLGALVGRGAKGLIPLGALAAFLLIPAGAVDNVIDDGVGSVARQPLSVTSLQSDYSIGLGELELDLSNIDFAGEVRTVDVEIGAGAVFIMVPPDVGGFVEAQMDVGSIDLSVPGRANLEPIDGIGVSSGRVEFDGDNGELRLRIDGDVGEIRVIQEPAR